MVLSVLCQLSCDVIGCKVRLLVAYLVAAKPLNMREVEGDLFMMIPDNIRRNFVFRASEGW